MPQFTYDKTLPKNLALLFKNRVYELQNQIYQYKKDSAGTFIGFTYKQVYEDVLSLAHALKKLGVARGENVALISDNRREWAITDFALLSLGAVDVPRGCDSMGTEIRFIISFAECKIAFFETLHQFEKILENPNECPTLQTAIIIKRSHRDQESVIKNGLIDVIYYDELISEGKSILYSDKARRTREIEDEMNLTESDDTATIIFTSGTTGTPKGVMLSHKSYLIQCSVAHNFFPAKPGETWLSVLPVWHSYERVIQYYIVTLKCNVAYSKPVAQVMISDMKKIRPKWMCAVPRLWDAISKSIQKEARKKGKLFLAFFNAQIKIGKLYKAQKDKVFGWVCRVTKRSRAVDFFAGIIPFILLLPLYRFADFTLFKRIRNRLGGKIRIATSGGGSLQKEVNDFYRAIDFNLLEVYGLTETAPFISIRHYKTPRPECVGAILPSMEIKIVQEENGKPNMQKVLGPGERGIIVVRSEQNMKGYYNREDLTAQIIDSDGWLNTGDIGLLTFDGELKITGRAKDTIVLLGGENIEPAIIERKLLSSDFIESAIVLGQDQNSLGCLIVPSKDHVLDFANKNDLNCSDYELLLKEEKIRDLFSKEIRNLVSVASGFRNCERINKFELLPNSFKIGEELSAKQEMMRPKIVKKYEKEISKLF